MALGWQESPFARDSTPAGAEHLHGSRVDLIYVFTDWAGSLDFKRRRGDTVGERNLVEHDRVFRECLRRCGGRENKDTGDGFLATFADAASAVRFALEFQRGIAAIPSPEPLACRVGIHSGRTFAIENPPEATNREKLVGVDVDLTARVMQLARPGQILLTREVFDAARVSFDPARDGAAPHWLAHGSYALDGTDDAFEIFEAGLPGASPLSPPPDSPKLRREPSAGDAAALGWRPSIGSAIPGREGWRLERRLGRGGIGEVWLGEDMATGALRAFKFCFSGARLRLLRREHTLFRLLRESLADCRAIAPLLAIQLDAPPFWLEMEYFPEGDLIQWSDRRGGIGEVPLEERLELAAQTAEALGQAHSAGVLHKDIKPRNILIRMETGAPRAVLADFGIGALLDPEALDAVGITASGFTRTASGATLSASSGSGTHVYMAPEQLAGRPASIQSDVYGVGVLLFQLVIGDFTRPLGSGWERAIGDRFLREDIAICVEGDPRERLADAAGLARRLRSLGERRAKAEAEERARAHAELSRRRFRVAVAALAASLALGALLAGGLYYEHNRFAREESQRKATEAALALAEYREYVGCVQSASRHIADQFNELAHASLFAAPAAHRAWEWGYLLKAAHPEAATLAGHSQPLLGARFSPDGRSLVTHARDGTARLWDFESGGEKAVLAGHQSRVNWAEYSPDSSRVVTASDDGTARVWDAEGRELFVLKGHAKAVNRARFSPNGELILTASDDGTARIWNAQSGEPRHVLEGHRDWVSDAEFSPDGRTVATASDDSTAIIWSAETGRALLTFAGHSDDVNDVEFSPDGARVLTASGDMTARIWDARTGRELIAPSRHQYLVRRARFSPDGRQYVSMSGDLAMVWNSETGTSVAFYSNGVGHELEDVRFSPDGSWLLIAGKDCALRVWDIAKSGMIWQARGDDYVVTCELSPDGAWAIATTGNYARIFPHGWSPLGIELDADDMSAAWSPDGRRLAIGDRAHQVVVVHPWGERRPYRWKAHTGSVMDAQFSPDGRKIVSASDDGFAKIWEAETARELARLGGHAGPVSKAVFSPDGARVATASEDGTAKIWDASDGRELLTLAPNSDWILDARFSPDGGAVLTAGRDGRVRLWDATTGAPIWVSDEHGADVFSARFSPDGARVATAGGAGAARVLDAKTGAEIMRIAIKTGGFRDMLFTPDGRRLIAAAAKGQTMVFDASNGRELISLAGTDLFDVRMLALSPDGSKLVAANTTLGLVLREIVLWSDLACQDGSGKDAASRLWDWQRARFARQAKIAVGVNNFRAAPPVTLEPQTLD